MSIIRNDAGEVRLAWRLILAILLFVAVAVLLRVIPSSLLTAILVRDGMTQGSALERANTIMLEDPIWSTVISTLFGLMGLLIVWLLVNVVERSTFTWKAVGLDWRGNSPLLIILGALGLTADARAQQQPSLKDVYKDCFLVGAAVNPAVTSGRDARDAAPAAGSEAAHGRAAYSRPSLPAGLARGTRRAPARFDADE